MAKVTDEALYQFLTEQMGYSQTEAIRIIGGISTRLTKAQAIGLFEQFSGTYGGQLNAPVSNQEWSTYKEGDEVTFTHNGRALKRYFYPDNYGNMLLAQNADGTNTDFVVKDNTPVYVVKDSSGVWYNPDTNKKFTDYNNQWSDYTLEAGLFEGMGGTKPWEQYGMTEPEYQDLMRRSATVDVSLKEADLAQLQQTLTSPTSTESEKNSAAMQLYGWLMEYANSSNQNAVTQWGNQANAFNSAYSNAIDQNKWIQEMSTSPLNTVAYLNLIRGQNPPNWQIPNYQQMPDAFQGWNQQQPTAQSMPSTAQVMQILQGLGWGQNQQQTTPTNWQVPSGQTYPITTPVENFTNVITPQNAPPSWTAPNPLPVMGGTENAGKSYYNGNWYTQAELQALLNPQPSTPTPAPVTSPASGLGQGASVGGGTTATPTPAQSPTFLSYADWARTNRGGMGGYMSYLRSIGAT